MAFSSGWLALNERKSVLAASLLDSRIGSSLNQFCWQAGQPVTV
jgi:hypothetical protein